MVARPRLASVKSKNPACGAETRRYRRRFIRSRRVGYGLPWVPLEFVDDASRQLRAELERFEVVAGHPVNRDTDSHVPVMAVEVNSAADDGADRGLAAVGCLGSDVGTAAEGVEPEIDPFGLDPAHAGSHCSGNEPGILAGLAAVGSEDFRVQADAIVIQ